MNKVIKIFIVTSIFILTYSKSIELTNASTTFPVQEAGISAYLKINESGPQKLAEALYFRKEIIEQKETHIIISFEIETEIKADDSGNNIIEKSYPLIYLNNDGWMVAYYPKETPSSKIMQWENYSPGSLNTTILEDALLKMTENIQATFTNQIRYYHFAYPEANRITIVAETVSHPIQNENNFSVIIPGEIYESSYFLYHSFRDNYTDFCEVKIIVDDIEIDSFSHSACNGKGVKYNEYPLNSFISDTPHLISLIANGRQDVFYNGGSATVFVYKVE
jgi:hypothetical protein